MVESVRGGVLRISDSVKRAMRSGGKLFCVAGFVSGTGVAGGLGTVADSGLRVAGKVDVPR
ncbi:MAG: hypothetical protein ACK5MO_15680 [Planctomyces sp.]